MHIYTIYFFVDNYTDQLIYFVIYLHILRSNTRAAIIMCALDINSQAAGFAAASYSFVAMSVYRTGLFRY